MDPKLLRAAGRGDCAVLEALLLGAAAAAAATPNQQVAIDVGSGQQSPLLLDAATTPQGDSALHVVAASGDGEGSLRCARTIYSHAARLLDRPNARGDTTLHCAARAGNAAMVRCLLDMAREEELAGSAGRVAEVMERQNGRRETALHDAVRLGDKQLVDHLISVHPRLARLPGGDGMSPLYLAVSLGHDHIAEALHQQGDELSYAGPAGQTALHAAVLRGAGMAMGRGGTGLDRNGPAPNPRLYPPSLAPVPSSCEKLPRHRPRPGPRKL
ncbi:Os11g0198682 [Oryza sativa Japonica Group]|uniref:Os11g0198682 protein n=1 Tax=Oryza sativa subsp. japonica TaxID=39947 RepID=A0A0P0Y0C4_ORYSJ|nr:Os11g0198682 [Oryza sativa Japonica Group]